MFRKAFLFITTILTATSVATGYDAPDSLKGNVNAQVFLDWFNTAEKYVHVKGLIILDLVPMLFLLVQAVLFFKDGKKIKGIFTVFAVLANLTGVFFVIQYAYPIASQMGGWTPHQLPSDWISLKDQWMKYIGFYALTGILGWLCFLITYFLANGENAVVRRLPRFLNVIKNVLTFILTFILLMGAARLYSFCFFPVSYHISGTTFIEMHRPLDLVIRKIGPVVFAVILSLLILLASLFFIERSRQKGWLIAAAVIFLLADTFIALQYNRPLNDLFLTWTPATIPVNWANLRDEWLGYHLYRDILITLQLSAVLLIYFVPIHRNTKQVLR